LNISQQTKQPTSNLVSKVTRGSGTYVLSIVLALSSLASNIGYCGETEIRDVDATKLKLAYLVNFARYTAWPEDMFDQPDSPIVIGISQYHPYAQQLDNKIAGHSRADRQIIFKMVEKLDSHSDIHLFYDKPPRLHEMLASDWNHHVLTVGDEHDFIEKGGIIQLVEVGQKIRFYINREKAESIGLKIHFKILEMAMEWPGRSSA